MRISDTFQNNNNMPSTILHGYDLPSDQTEILLVCTGFRKAPMGFGSPVIMEFEPLPGLEGLKDFPVNRTNLEAFANFIGDDLDVVIGKYVALQTTDTTNPKTGQATRGLKVIGVYDPHQPMSAQQKPGSKPAAAAMKTGKVGMTLADLQAQASQQAPPPEPAPEPAKKRSR